MKNMFNEPKIEGVFINKAPALIVWVLFLSIIIIPVAVIVNFNLGYNQFKIEMAEHWIDYQPDSQVSASTNANTGLSANTLEKTYNKIASTLNDVCVNIEGGRVINGVPDQAHGSGIIVAEQYVLTNYHVVENATDITVTVYSPSAIAYQAKVIMTDKINDFALLKVKTNKILPCAILGNSDNVKAGDMVFAMGNTFGSGNVFTTGVICDKTQSFFVDGRAYQNMIRTETYLYPGSIGGPLADINGEIIGVNTAIYDPQGKPTGISFATPINRALALLKKANLTDFNGASELIVPAAYSVNKPYNNNDLYALAA